jgi:hypothetical protein
MQKTDERAGAPALADRQPAVAGGWSVPAEPGARFENLVASHLLKWAEWQHDAEGRDVELR